MSVHGCYGYRVECEYPEAARPVVHDFFGAPSEAGTALADAPTLRLTFTVAAVQTGPTVAPPHNLAVMMGDPVVVDAGSSRAVLDTASAVGQVTLAAADLDNQVVWGRWILERLFVYLVCRSPRHYPLHAGAIGVDGRFAIVAAAGGVGKSTFAYWAWHRGAVLAGEDILVRHLDDPATTLWGYPRALYLAPDLIHADSELAHARATAIDGGAKCRITVPPALAHRLQPRFRPSCLVFLVRGESGGPPRPVDLDDAIERCREDFAIAKEPAPLARVEADLRGLLRDLPVWEFEVSADLDESYDRLRAALRTLPA